MRKASLEERVAALEKQVNGLLESRAAKRAPKNWRRTRDAFTGDDLMKQILEEGRKIREAARTRARPRVRKKAKSS